MRTTAKADYAVRAAIELAAAGDLATAEQIAHAQRIPVNFLENILRDLRRGGIVESRRGAQGGYVLARPAADISLADVIRAVEGPLANVRGLPQRARAGVARGRRIRRASATRRGAHARRRRVEPALNVAEFGCWPRPSISNCCSGYGRCSTTSR